MARVIGVHGRGLDSFGEALLPLHHERHPAHRFIEPRAGQRPVRHRCHDRLAGKRGIAGHEDEVRSCCERGNFGRPGPVEVRHSGHVHRVRHRNSREGEVVAQIVVCGGRRGRRLGAPLGHRDMSRHHHRDAVIDRGRKWREIAGGESIDRRVLHRQAHVGIGGDRAMSRKVLRGWQHARTQEALNCGDDRVAHPARISSSRAHANRRVTRANSHIRDGCPIDGEAKVRHVPRLRRVGLGDRRRSGG